MVPHEREECGWAVVECSYQCGAHLPRRLMDEHQRDECPQQPVEVKLESFMKRMETKLMTERERHEKEIREMEERNEREMKKMGARLSTERERYQREMVAMKREMSESKR